MSEFKSLEELDKAFEGFSATLARTARAIIEIVEAARRLNRDLIRLGRRPALIHNGGRPRARRR